MGTTLGLAALNTFSGSRAIHLLTIPPEVLVEIVLLLTDLYDILAIKSVCRQLKQIVDGSVAIQYHAELSALGYESKPRVNLTIAESREILKKHQRSLNLLDWTESRIEFRVKGLTKFSCGTFATTEPGSRSISLLDFPSIVNDTPMRRWEHGDVGVEVLNFSIDRNLDLLLIIERPPPFAGTELFSPRVHVRTLSTASFHPRAGQNKLEVPTVTVPGHYCTAQIMGNMYGALFVNGIMQQKTLIIWDWLTGGILATLDGGTGELYSFTLLNSESFLATRTTRTSGFIDVYHITSSKCSPTHTASFELPLIYDGTMGPMYVTQSHSPLLSTGSKDKRRGYPFQVAPDNRTLHFKFVVQSRSSGLKDVSIFAPVSTFILDKPTDTADDEPLTLKSWETWGPQNTRFCFGRSSASQVYGVSGSRFVITGSVPGPGPSGKIVSLSLLDFTTHASTFWKTNTESADMSNLSLIGRALEPLDNSVGSYVVPRSHPTTVVDKCFLGSVVETSLPFCVTSRKFTDDQSDLYRAQLVLCDDERLVCIQPPGNLEMSELVILTLSSV